jgi:hypothetical protein
VNRYLSSLHGQRRELFWFFARKVHRRLENSVGCEPTT